ncbi:MAG: glycosyltransferase family 9 protein [Chitinophagales bacterium]|nr:glycosyltransferase family 9 protein [Chitinophagales bacterium]MDW8427056.1 glycosyltransferase family 9 protein [Chitinophagales bacterium]
MRVLLIRYSSIGDLVLISPVIRCLRKSFPQATIDLLTSERYRHIHEANPYLNNIFYQHNRESLPSLVRRLRSNNYDFVADLHNNRKSLLVRWLLNKPSAALHKFNLEKWLLVHFKINWLPPVHVVDRYLDVVRSLGVRNDGRGLDYFIPAQEEINLDQLPLSHVHGYAAIAIGAAHATKRLPLAQLQQLTARLPLPIVLLGGPEEKATGDLLHQAFPYKVVNGCGMFSLHQSASLIRQAKVVITHDTGLMHIAAAFRKRMVSVWGNTVPAFGMTPYFGSEPAESFIVERKGLWCRPCSKLGFHRCPLGHFRCMNELRVETIVQLAMYGQ